MADSDSVLLDRKLQGDDLAFEALFLRHHAGVYVARYRVYTVFAIAPDETTEADTIRDFFDSFRLLNP